jgi:hypothetical protein
MVRSYLIENRRTTSAPPPPPPPPPPRDDGPDETPPAPRGIPRLYDVNPAPPPTQVESRAPFVRLDESFTVTAGQDNVARSNPNEMRAREQAVQDDYISRFRPDLDVGSSQARDAFANLVSNPSPGISAQVAEVQRAERAAAERQALGPVIPAPVVAAPTPVNDSAEMARQLIENAANESIASGIDREILDSVPGAAGRNDPASGFFADAYDELYGGTAPGTGIGTLLTSGPLGALTNQPDPADAAAFNVGTLQRMARETGTGTVNPNTGAVTGVRAGPGTLSMNSFGGVVYSGVPDPNYVGPFQNLVRGNTGTMSSEDTDDGGQMAQQTATEPVDPGTTTPEQIDDLAINYLRNPFYLYSGANNLFQPYGYAGGTLVDLLQTRNMTMPDQAAPNLNLFGNPRDFT